LTSPFGAATVLRDKLAPLRELYDAIVIDCPPTLSLLTVNALSAADYIVVPCKTDYLSIMGVPLLLDTIENVRSRVNSKLTLVGILPTMFLKTASHDNALLAELREVAEAQHITVFDPVSRATAFDKANAEGKSTLELYPETKGIEQYRIVADKIIAYAS
jgi:chromosome partitioning protein